VAVPEEVEKPCRDSSLIAEAAGAAAWTPSQGFLRDRDRSPERWFCEKQGRENGAMVAS
jgi:hypothetical protein